MPRAGHQTRVSLPGTIIVRGSTTYAASRKASYQAERSLARLVLAFPLVFPFPSEWIFARDISAICGFRVSRCLSLRPCRTPVRNRSSPRGFHSGDLLSASRSLPLGGSRRPVGATRLPRAISPSTFSFALLSSWLLFLSLSLSLPLTLDLPLQTSSDRPRHRLTVEETVRVRAKRDADRSRDDFSDLAAL